MKREKILNYEVRQSSYQFLINVCNRIKPVSNGQVLLIDQKQLVWCYQLPGPEGLPHPSSVIIVLLIKVRSRVESEVSEDTLDSMFLQDLTYPLILFKFQDESKNYLDGKGDGPYGRVGVLGEKFWSLRDEKSFENQEVWSGLRDVCTKVQ